MADEPTGNLDPDLSHDIFAQFREIHRQGTTVLVATHDPLLRPPARHHVLTLQRGQMVGDEYPGSPGAQVDTRVDAGLDESSVGGDEEVVS